MNKAFINTIFILLFIAFVIMAVTGFMFIFKAGNHFVGELHEITGLVFIGLIIIHIITFRKMLCNFMSAKTTKSK